MKSPTPIPGTKSGSSARFNGVDYPTGSEIPGLLALPNNADYEYWWDWMSGDIARQFGNTSAYHCPSRKVAITSAADGYGHPTALPPPADAGSGYWKSIASWSSNADFTKTEFQVC